MNDEEFEKNFVERRFPTDRQIEGGWHLDKKVPLSLIFAMMVQAAMVIWAVADIKKDVELLKADVVTLHVRDSKIESDTRDAVRLLQEQLTRIDQKLDRLIERRQ
jgi:hypothetical protein